MIKAIRNNNELKKQYGDVLDMGISIFDSICFGGSPILQGIKTVTDFFASIPQQIFAIKFYNFLKALELHDQESIDVFKDKLSEKFNSNNIDKSRLEWIFVMIDSYNETKKSGYLGTLFLAYINDIIQWNDFCEYSFAIDNLLISDLDVVLKSTVIRKGTIVNNDPVAIYESAKLGKEDNQELILENKITLPKSVYLRLAAVGLANIDGETLHWGKLPNEVEIYLDKKLESLIDILETNCKH